RAVRAHLVLLRHRHPDRAPIVERDVRLGEDLRAPAGDRERGERLAVPVERLEAAVPVVADPDAARGVDADADRLRQLARLLPLPADLRFLLAVGREADDPVVAGVGDVDRAGRIDRDAARPEELASELAEVRAAPVEDLHAA